METRFIPETMDYTGEQLHSHWAYRRFDILGDSLLAFVGACDVKPEYMKDVEDLRSNSRIYSERMLHFILEQFDADMDRAVLRQRLLIVLIAEALTRRAPALRLLRKGSDLYDGAAKLTVSVASVSPVSSLIHAGINVSSRNTPVPTRGLEDYGIPPREFAEEVLAAWVRECEALRRARCKVRGCE